MIELASGMEYCEGPGGLACIRIQAPLGPALLSLQGAQVLEFGKMLWLSPTARFEAGQAIRGGIPLCWPRFGRQASQITLPQHGFARVMLWRLAGSSRRADGSAVLNLDLEDSPQSRKIWPEAFHLSLEIRLGASLELELRVENRGERAWDHQAAFHPYFQTPDLRGCGVLGLSGLDYLEKREERGMGHQSEKVLKVAEGLDRIYFKSPPCCSLSSESAGVFLEIEKEGAIDTVVWNPGPGLLQAPADLCAELWKDFLCVEALSSYQMESLERGKSRRMMMRMTPISGAGSGP